MRKLALLCLLAATPALADEDFEAERRVCFQHSNWAPTEHVAPGVANPPQHWQGDFQQLCTDVEARAKAASDAAKLAQPANDLKFLQETAKAAAGP